MSLVCAAVLAAGCTFEDGQGWGQVRGELWARFAGLDAAAGRVQADGWFKTDTSFELKIDKLALTLRKLELLGQKGAGTTASGSASGGSCTFDPSDPPAGCSLCHGDHCHCDGKLKSYSELQAEMCGGAASGGATSATLATLRVPAAQDLLGQGTRSTVSGCTPSCDLPLGQATGVKVALERLVLAATVRDQSLENRLSGATPGLTVDWDLAGAGLSHTLAAAAPVDRDADHVLDLAVELPLTAKLLDGILLHKLTPNSDGSLTIDKNTNKSAGEALTTNLAATTLKVTVTRKDD